MYSVKKSIIVTVVCDVCSKEETVESTEQGERVIIKLLLDLGWQITKGRKGNATTVICPDCGGETLAIRKEEAELRERLKALKGKLKQVVTPAVAAVAEAEVETEKEKS